jgi:hypothetical protein
MIVGNAAPSRFARNGAPGSALHPPAIRRTARSSPGAGLSRSVAFAQAGSIGGRAKSEGKRGFALALDQVMLGMATCPVKSFEKQSINICYYVIFW